MALLLSSRKTRPYPLLHRRFFSTSGSGDGDQNPPRSNSPFTPFFQQVKGELKKPSPLNNRSPQSSAEEIHKNLAEFRRVTSVPLPSGSPSSGQISFVDIFNKTSSRNGTESTGNPNPGHTMSGRSSLSFTSLREKLHKVDESKGRDRMSSKLLKDALGKSSDFTVVGGTSALPESISGRDKRRGDGISSDSTRTEFLKMYGVQELGEKLRKLRSEVMGKQGFSIAELNERLAKLRDLEEKEAESIAEGVTSKDLRDCLTRIAEASERSTPTKASLQRLDILGQLGGTPTYMLMPPKEYLVEKFFHPDNMSSAEKLKIELAKVREEFKMSESDCGSARVQVAQLTTKIKHLSAVLHKKDVHSRKGLVAMVQKRKRLLKYLRRTDWDSYCFVISKLGLRDNPEHTYRGRTGKKVAT